jgi:hypothetical protein
MTCPWCQRSGGEDWTNFRLEGGSESWPMHTSCLMEMHDVFEALPKAERSPARLKELLTAGRSSG